MKDDSKEQKEFFWKKNQPYLKRKKGLCGPITYPPVVVDFTFSIFYSHYVLRYIMQSLGGGLMDRYYSTHFVGDLMPCQQSICASFPKPPVLPPFLLHPQCRHVSGHHLYMISNIGTRPMCSVFWALTVKESYRWTRDMFNDRSSAPEQCTLVIKYLPCANACEKKKSLETSEGPMVTMGIGIGNLGP